MIMANYQNQKYLTIHLELKIRKNELEIGNCTKFLGIYVNQNLSWKKHFKETSKKVSRALGMLKQANKVFPPEALKNLYTSIVEPSLCYDYAVRDVAIRLKSIDYRSYKTEQ